MLLKGLLDESPYFPHIIFNNIVSSAIQNKEAIFAENFINVYKDKLLPEEKINIVDLSYAKLYYHTKQYDKALSHLSKTSNNEDIFYKFAIKDLNMKIFYETEQYEPIFSIIDSYKHFLHNDEKLTDDVRKRYSLFLKMFGELLKIKLNTSREKIEDFKNILNKNEAFINKDWITDKLDELSAAK